MVSALVYPAVLVGLSIAMIVMMAVFVVPKFMVFFEDLDVELPLITRITLAISASFASQNWLILAGGGRRRGVLVPLALEPHRRGRPPIDAGCGCACPSWGRCSTASRSSEFCRSLATLLTGGIPLVPALRDRGHRAVGNAQRAQQARARRSRWCARARPSTPRSRPAACSLDMSIDMIKVGEATGSLDDMLSSVADFLDEQVETRMQRLLSLIEPMMLVVMGIIIAMMLISIYLPMFSVLGSD